jgi:hypothetical protein
MALIFPFDNAPGLQHPAVMRIPVLVQNTRTSKFLTKDGKWTSKVSGASVFYSAQKAIEFCLRKKLDTVGLVYRFEGFNHNVTVPLALDGIRKKG